MAVRPSRPRRLLAAALYAGCAGAAVFALRPMVWADSPATPSPVVSTPPTDVGPFLLPPGTWSVLSAERLGDLHLEALDQAGPPVGTARSPLLPPGVEPLAVRADAAGRVSAFLTDAEDWAAFTRHWAGDGWEVAETRDAAAGTRTLTLRRRPERALAWVIPSRRLDRVHLLVTVSDQPK